MIVDQRTMYYARLALRKAVRDHLFDRNINLIDFGNPFRDGAVLENDLAIRVHVYERFSPIELEVAEARGLTKEVPQRIDGFETNVIEATYRPNRNRFQFRISTTNPRMVRSDPLRGGMSISDERHNLFGTLGCRVIDRATGEEMLLSNWHVLVVDWFARSGQRIFQPGRRNGGTFHDTVATLVRDAMSLNLDAAVARLNGTRRFVNDQIELGPIRGVGRPEIGMAVKKSGCATNVTHGRVTAIEGTAKLTYAFVQKMIRNVITIQPLPLSNEVSGPGDSGSVWVNEKTMEAIALHFAGSNFPEIALAMDMRSILDALSVDIDTEVEAVTEARVRSAVSGRQPRELVMA